MTQNQHASILEDAKKAGHLRIAPYVRDVLAKNHSYLELALSEIRHDVKKILEVVR